MKHSAKILVIALGLNILAYLAFAGFTGVTINNKSGGPIYVTIRCFNHDSEEHKAVVANDESPKDISIYCKNLED